MQRNKQNTLYRIIKWQTGFTGLPLVLLSVSMLLSACGGTTSADTDAERVISEADTAAGTDAADTETAADTDSTMDAAGKADEASVQGSRDNTPRVLRATADGITAYEDDQIAVDISNISSGYFMIEYKGSNEKPKLQVTGPEAVTYTFDIHGGEETIPFTQGSGTYQIAAYEHIGDGKYAQLCAVTVDADIGNEYSPYLYPNQYVNFNENSEVVKLGEELAYTADSDLDVVSDVYNYLISNITYDTDLAANVTSGYLPDPDATIASHTGICFDYAAVMASMLRSQQIPTRLEIGYAGDAYHAWVSTYIDETGWVNGIVEFDGTDWELMDPTLAASQGEKALKSFIGDGSNYVKVYQY